MRHDRLTESLTAISFAVLLSVLAACAGGDPNSPMARESNEAAIENEAAADVLLESER